MADKRIGDLLVEYGVVSRVELETAMREEIGRGRHSRVASTLLRAGIDEGQLARALARRSAHPAVDLSRSVLDLGALGMISQDDCLEAKAMPVKITADEIVLVSRDREPQAFRELLSFLSNKVITVYLGVEQAIEEAVERGYKIFENGDALLSGAETDLRKAHLEIVPGGTSPSEEELTQLVQSLVRSVGSDQVAPSGKALGQIALKRIAVVQPRLGEMPTEFGAEVEIAAPVSAQAQPTAEWSGPGRILVADDDADIRKMIETILSKDGHLVATAEDGSAAIASIKAQKPDVLILDGMMPGMHGFEICRHLKGSDHFKDVRVIVVTAVHRGLDTARQVQEEYLADAFLEKPFEVQLLRKMVSSMIGLPLERLPLPDAMRSHIESMRDKLDEHLLVAEFQQADNIVREWLNVDPFDPLAHLYAGNLFCQRGQLPLAMREFETATIFGPELFSAWTNLALVYERLGFVRKAEESWRAARAAGPADAHARIDTRLARLRG